MRQDTLRRWTMSVGAIATMAMLMSSGCSDSVGASRADVMTVTIEPSSATLAPGASAPLEAVVRDAASNVLTDREVFWSSEDDRIATVSAEGIVTAIAAGSVRIAASSEGKSALARINVVTRLSRIVVTPDHVELIPGETKALTAVGRDDKDKAIPGVTVQWTTNDERIATVSETGVVTAVAPGTAVVSATSGGISGAATIVVHPAPVATIEVTPATLSLGVGEAGQLVVVLRDANGVELNDRVVSWTTSDDGVAIVSSTGLVLARARGSAVVTATSEGKKATVAVDVHDVAVASVAILPSSATIGIGGSVQLVAVPRDAAGNPLPGRTVDWTTDAPTIATVSSSGFVSGLAGGVARITATSEGKSATAEVTVQGVSVARVEVSPVSLTMNVGTTRQLTAKVFDAAGNELTGRTVTWSSGNTFIATVDATGRVRAVKRGEVTITATSEGQSGNSFVKVQ
jgi:uncharacterized protein YjdB